MSLDYPVRPIRNTCLLCKHKVLNHHFLCDTCWGKKKKSADQAARRIKRTKYLQAIERKSGLIPYWKKKVST